MKMPKEPVYPAEACFAEILHIPRHYTSQLKRGDHVELAGSCRMENAPFGEHGVFCINSPPSEEDEYWAVANLKPLTRAAREMLKR